MDHEKYHNKNINFYWISLKGINQLVKLLFIPLVIGLDLFALKTILNKPMDNVYLLSGLAFLYLNRKNPNGAFTAMITTVKNTINLKYPI